MVVEMMLVVVQAVAVTVTRGLVVVVIVVLAQVAYVIVVLVLVVDEGAEGGHLAALIQQTVGQLDRAVHAEAETRSLCKSDFHCLSFLF